MSDRETTSTIVVGVDGSNSALAATRWAVDEAVVRNIPLRLVYVVEDDTENTGTMTAAQAALNDARAAIEATGKPVKVETEVVHGRALGALAHAARFAEMLCVGPIGRKHATGGRVGSTAAALPGAAHCPVAVVRNHGVPEHDDGCVVVDLEESPADGPVLQCGVEEARLRGAPLCIVATWHSRFNDTDDDRRVQAQLDRRLSRWMRRYPDVDIRSAAVHGSILDYLAKNAPNVRLVVVGAGAAGDAGELLGPNGSAVLRQADCSVLVVGRRRL